MQRLIFGLLLALSFVHDGAAQMDDKQDEKAFLDKHYPFVAPKGPFPGGWVKAQPRGKIAVVDERGRHWQGQSGWRTRHGAAVILWRTGTPLRVFDARLPDGSRGEVRFKLDFGFRRPAKGPRLWIYGKLDIQSNDVVFIDGEQPNYTPPPQADAPNLEADLARDDKFLAALKDERFARSAYKLLQNATLYKGADERASGFGIREAARVFAGMRGVGESYLDYYGTEGEIDSIDVVSPDWRPELEGRLRREIEEWSRPLKFNPPPLPFDYGERRIETPEQLDSLRREIESQMPAYEKRRAEHIAHLRQKLAGIDKGVAAWNAINAHLTRLGWRFANDADRLRERQKESAAGVIVLRQRLAERIQLLREINALMQRPAGATPDWALPFRSEFTGTRSYPVTIARHPAGYDRLTTEERQAYHADFASRIRFLAFKGRLSKEEFDSLMSRAVVRR